MSVIVSVNKDWRGDPSNLGKINYKYVPSINRRNVFFLTNFKSLSIPTRIINRSRYIYYESTDWYAEWYITSLV